MSKIKTNRFQQAIVELSELDKNQLQKLNEEIDIKDSKHYHVAMVTIITREGQAKNDVRVSVGKFHEQGFKKLEKNFIFFGYTKLIILHDPNSPIEGVEETKETTIENVSSKPLMTEAEMEAEIERRANEKATEIIGSLGSEETKNDSGDLLVEGKEIDNSKNVPYPFEKGQTAEIMKAFAKEHDIELSGLRKVDEIKAVLLTWYNEQVEQANKQ